MNSNIIHGIEGDSVGATVYWDLCGLVSITRFTAGWEAAGLDPAKLPERTSREVALRRALQAVSPRALRHRSAAGSWAVAEVGEQGDGRPELHHGIKAWLRGPHADLVVEPAGHPGEGELRDQFLVALATWDASTFGSWLSSRVEHGGGLALRERGALYYIRPGAVAQWKQVTALVAAETRHRIHLIPSVRGDAAVEAVLSALRAEVAKRLGEFSAAVADGKQGHKALRSRQAEAVALSAKVESYAKLLGVTLDGLTASVKAAEADINAVALAGEEDRPRPEVKLSSLATANAWAEASTADAEAQALIAEAKAAMAADAPVEAAPVVAPPAVDEFTALVNGSV